MRRLIAGAIILIASIAVTVAQQEPPKPQEQKPEQKQASPPAQGQRGATPAKPIVPLAVIAEMLGLPREDWDHMFRLSNTLLGASDPE